MAMAAMAAVAFQVTPGLPPKVASRQQHVGLASSKVFVDSPVSQVVSVGDAVSEQGSATDLAGLMTRAQLLASLMSTSPLKDRVAAEAGLRGDRLEVLAPTGFASPLSISESAAAPDDPRVNVLDLSVDESLPILNLNVRAPDERSARRLAGAAVAVLGRYLEEMARGNAVPTEKRLAASRLGPATSETITTGPRRLVMMAVFAVVLGVWIVGILTLPRFIAYWRHLGASDPVAAPAHEADLPGQDAAVHDQVANPVYSPHLSVSAEIPSSSGDE